MIRRPPRSTQSRSSAASDVYKRQLDPSRDIFAGGGCPVPQDSPGNVGNHTGSFIERSPGYWLAAVTDRTEQHLGRDLFELANALDVATAVQPRAFRSEPLHGRLTDHLHGAQ